MRLGPLSHAVRTTASSPLPRKFTCEQCGAVLNYAPGTATLVCSYCGHENRIVEQPVEIVEHALAPALIGPAAAAPEPTAITTKCTSCAADFTFPPDFHAGPCPFCGMAVVVDPSPYRPLAPEGVLPFLVGEQEARRLVGEWLKGLWFAPSGVAEQARGPGRLEGVYVPYWTFDSRTRTDYSGQRGDVYYVTEYVTENVDGRVQRRPVQVPKIRWTPVRGTVARDFDDVLVVAGESLPRALVERLEPWDLDGLKPYAADYLSGFRSELYQVPVTQGFETAKAIMREVIQGDVRHDIGGDQQTIGSMAVDFQAPTYKHVLLPVWQAAFRFVSRDYRFVINGRTGEVHGERPWSWWKIGAAVLLGVILIFLLALLFSQSPELQRLLSMVLHSASNAF